MDITVTDSTTLDDLLALKLHLFEDEVRNIVDKAVKEMTIEKVLLYLYLFVIRARTNITIVTIYLPSKLCSHFIMINIFLCFN